MVVIMVEVVSMMTMVAVEVDRNLNVAIYMMFILSSNEVLKIMKLDKDSHVSFCYTSG